MRAMADPPRDPIHRFPSAELPERGSIRFTYPGPGGPAVEAFAVRADGRVRAFVNACPHWGVGLDMDDGVFWTPDGLALLCRNHGALFRPEDGWCESGPCFGGSLRPIPVVEEDGEVRCSRPAWPDAADWL